MWSSLALADEGAPPPVEPAAAPAPNAAPPSTQPSLEEATPGPSETHVPPAELAPAPTLPYSDPAPPHFSGIQMGTRRFTRDGLLLRPTLGLGVTHIFRRIETSGTAANAPTSTSSSITAVPLEFRGLIGAGLTRDIIFGGFLGISQSPGATFNSLDDADLSLAEGISLQMVGLQMLYFLQADSPWQLGTSVAFLNWSAHQAANDGEIPSGAGILVTLEAGYHVWVGSRFELGVLADVDFGATQDGRTFRISEVLIQSSETSFLARGSLAIALSYY